MCHGEDGPGDEVIVTVSDQCGGIAERDIERVFDLAYRGDTARSPSQAGGSPNGVQPVGGGGLGLAIAKGFLEAHHGVIGVHNEGIGCTFTVCMPRWHPETVAAE